MIHVFAVATPLLTNVPPSTNRISPPQVTLTLSYHYYIIRVKTKRVIINSSLLMQQYIHSGSNTASLAEHMGTKISDHLFMTPNKLSEEMVKCASSIYSKLLLIPKLISIVRKLSFHLKNSMICGVQASERTPLLMISSISADLIAQ